MKTEIIVTLGPSTNTENHLRKLKSQGVSFVRINMSHSTVNDLRRYINLAKKVDIPFIIDTEGSQIRTGNLKYSSIKIEENDEIKIYKKQIQGDKQKICIKPKSIVDQLEPGDILRLDFDTLILRVSDTSTLQKGYILAKAVTGGNLGNNKGVVIDSGFCKKFVLPALSKKDCQSIKIGLKEGIEYIAASFMRSGAFVDEVRATTQGKMKIISKIECIDGLNHLDEIIKKSEGILIDRGDLSKEIPLERIPFSQKIILYRTRLLGKRAIVATNLLETMVQNRKPTRAEIQDIVNSVVDGATGLTLSAETAIGKYPFECVNTMQKLISHIAENVNIDEIYKQDKKLVRKLEKGNYLSNYNSHSGLIEPHGGKLVDRCVSSRPQESFLRSLTHIRLSENKLMDLEQIAFGTYSPIEGFMNKREVKNVLDKMRLPNGVIWPIPIMLDVSKELSKTLIVGKPVALMNQSNRVVGLLHLEEIYDFDKRILNQKLYGTQDENHPGVQMINKLHTVFLGGKIDLYERRKKTTQEFELTPLQVRRLFEERNWSKIVGFHTRNVIHRSHEFIQMKALEQEFCDGLFVQPVIGQKKPGDFQSKYIINSYQTMMKNFYPKNRVLFAALGTYSRYAGPREAIFTALCRKNFGCSHFIVGRDHTGVGSYYSPTISQEIFDKFPDLGIKPIKFDNIIYSTKLKSYIYEKDSLSNSTDKVSCISGTQAREIFKKGKIPPEWFMRPEISLPIAKAIKKGEEVFVKRKGNILWFTGLSGSGKTTIANALAIRLKKIGKTVKILDGDIVRATKNKHLGFLRKDIKENNRLIAEMAKIALVNTDFVLVPVISPYEADRKMVKKIIGENFIEIFVNTPLSECIKRDVKGMYKKAIRGEIKNFIGISPKKPYESPKLPDIEINTMKTTLEEGVQKILDFLESNYYEE